MTESQIQNAQPDQNTNVLLVSRTQDFIRPVLEMLARRGTLGMVAGDAETALDFLEKNDSSCGRQGQTRLVLVDDAISKQSVRPAGPASTSYAEAIPLRPRSEASKNDAFELIERIRTGWPEMPVIMVATSAEILTADGRGDHPEKSERFPGLSPGNSKGISQGAETAEKKTKTTNSACPPGASAVSAVKNCVETAVRAMRAGCQDFLGYPVSRKTIAEIIDTYVPNRPVHIVDSTPGQTGSLFKIVGSSQALLQTVNLAKKVAPTSAPVLITGESGTGKELISSVVHYTSRRADGPFVKINCAALSETLLESELFGHEKGAFTGAYAQRKGRFEAAHGGTLLLDEISETPLRFQAKLLRVLEGQDFQRVGSNDNVNVDVRIISTTNKDLSQEVAQGRFRQDLHYRLGAIRLVVPALKQRKEDIPDLVWHFVNLYAGQARRRITSLDPAMMNIFSKYHWPGNVRQLRNVILTSMIMGTGETLSLADVSWLFDELQPLPEITNTFTAENAETAEKKIKVISANSAVSAVNGGLTSVSLAHLERQAILDTLKQTNGNQTRAAKVLGISDRTLRDKIRRFRQQGCLQPA